jgi:hypothetical protein
MARASGFLRFPIEARGLREFQKELRSVDDRFDGEFRRVFADVTDLMEVAAKRGAGSRLAAAIRPAETARAARLRLTRNPPDALARFYGAKRRTGWFAAMFGDVASEFGVSEADRRFPDRQFPPWIGNQWEPGATGGVPYLIGEPINRTVPQAIDLLNDGLGRIFDRAFPES